MEKIPDAFIIIFLYLITIQDFRQRKISWILIPLLILFMVMSAAITNSLTQVFRFALFNSCFMIFQLVLLTLYFSIKKKKITNIINSNIGIGDILFFLVLCLAFSPLNFTIYYLSSLIITLIGFTIYKKKIIGIMKAEIPLAGAFAISLILCLGMKYFVPISLYQDNWFMQGLNYK